MPDINVAHPLARYRNHLEFHGYHVEEVDEEDNLLLCRHSRKTNLIIRSVPSRGVLVSTCYSFDPNISRIKLLEYVNQLNANFLFMKAYIDDEDSFTMETFFEGDYDRTNFSILLDNVEFDMEVLFRHDLTEQYLC